MMTEPAANHETDTTSGTHDLEDGSQHQVAATPPAVILAGRWLGSHPAVTYPAGAAIAFGTLAYIGAGPPSASATVLALIAAVIAAFISSLIVLRFSSPRPGTGMGLSAGRPPAGNFRVAVAARPRPGPPQDMAGALRIIEGILAELRPGPERITAVDPDAIQVRWDRDNFHSRAADLPGARRDKMLVIHGAVRRAATQLRVLHQLPQLLLVAEDGAVAEMFGGDLRTGVVTSWEAPMDSAAAAG